MSSAADLPTIALVTPSRDQAPYLEATLRSVLDQGYPRLRYAVVDGGSRDGSAAIIARYGERLAWWVSEPDDGPVEALNKGFAHVEGEVMGWLNSSDLHLPWTLHTVAAVFRDLPEVEWVLGLQTEADAGGRPFAVHARRWNRYDLLAGDYRWLQQESVFWRRSLWERAGGRLDPRVRHACDLALWLRFADLAPLYHVPLPLGVYRHHGERRGTAGGRYAAEAAEVWAAWRSRAGARDRRRAALISLLPRRGRDAWRALLARSPLPSWYRHPQLVFDHGEGRWRVAGEGGR